MKRINLTDDSGLWFDAHKAACFAEETRWDGSNHISVPTGSQWDHQALYFTKSGRWVLNCWSQWQGSSESYELVSQDDAADWLQQNLWLDKEYEELDRLPGDVLAAIKARFERQEV